VISKHEIDAVFDAQSIKRLAAVLKRSPSAKLFTETTLERFSDSIRMAVRCYLVERERTNWTVITDRICKLYRLLEKASRGNAKAISVLAKQVDHTDAATRAWLERCVYHSLTFPSAREIRNKETRSDTMYRLRCMLCDSWVPCGRSSRLRQPRLRVPQKTGPDDWRTLAGRRGRPRDLAARELVQQLALTYLEATAVPLPGRSVPPPRRVNSKRPGPFLRFVRLVFEMANLPTGNVEELINERQKRREDLSTQFLSQLSLEQAKALETRVFSTSGK
jgi:hypothetical protein